MLRGYPEGSRLTLIDTVYHYPKREENGKYSDGAIDIIFKETDTGIKRKETIVNPEYEFYMIKPEYVTDYNQLYIHKSKVDPIRCKYKDLPKTIAELTDNLDFYYSNIKSGNRSTNKLLNTLPEVMFSDMQIEDYYRYKFWQAYPCDDLSNITKAYFDIEADTINMKGDFPELGECPINAVSYIDDAHNKVYTLLLRNKKNPLIEKLESSMGPWFIKKIRETIEYAVGGKKAVQAFGLDKLEFEIQWYDDELELIHDLFLINNNIKPDFLLAWNMAFDIPYIIERLKNLGVDPASVMCHPDFEFKECEYFVDERVLDQFAERGDFARVSCYSVLLDQLIHFASRRKGQGAFKNLKLDNIGKIVCKVRKLDYSHITTNIAKLPYLDYETFVIYNIVDTIVQKCIEMKTGDIDYVFGKSNVNATRYHKCHRQTVYLTNRGRKEFIQDDLVMGNNTTILQEKPEGKFKGALVGDPAYNMPDNMMKLNFVPIRVAENIIDFDFTALYPSEMTEANMCHESLIGKIFFNGQIHANENPFNNDDYDQGGQFMEDFASKNILEFATRWLHLGSFGELYNDIRDYLGEKYNSNARMIRHGYTNPVTYEDSITSVARKPGEVIRPVYYYSEDKPNFKREAM